KATFTNTWELAGYDAIESATFTQGLATLIHPENQRAFLDDVQAFLDGRELEWEGEVRVGHKDGTDRWHLARGVAQRDPGSGRALRFTGSSVDITELRLAEQKLRESEEQFHAAFENAAVGMAISLPGARFVECNQKLCEILGYAKEEIVGADFSK